MPSTPCWARLYASVLPHGHPAPRAGAWYSVMVDVGGTLVIEIAKQRVILASHLFELRDDRPKLFSVVRHIGEAINVFGRRYAVCPACAGRVPLPGRPATLACPRCSHHGLVAWDEIGALRALSA